jgi:hypothetical protein
MIYSATITWRKRRFEYHFSDSADRACFVGIVRKLPNCKVSTKDKDDRVDQVLAQFNKDIG